MRQITSENLETEFIIYKTLTQNKAYKTLLALKEGTANEPYFVILKEMDKKRAQIYKTLSGMWNPFRANTYEVLHVTDATPDYYIAVTEYVCAEQSPEAESVTLAQFVRQVGALSESAALSVCIQICEGLKDFHKCGYVHRDLKPDNIMISHYDAAHPRVKIIDFGGAKWQKRSVSADTTVIGTLGYQPPESLSFRTSCRSDIYSIGCILNFLLTAKNPGNEIYKKNHYIEQIIETATAEDSVNRYTNVSALQDALNHELGVRRMDRIPFLRALPGYRSHKFQNEVIATICYVIMILMCLICVTDLGGISALLEVAVCDMLIPLILLFNMGNLLRFFPKSLRRNRSLFLLIRICLLFTSLLLPLLFDYIQ